MNKILLGIDLGTSSVKVRAVSEDGNIIGQESRGYPTLHPHDGWAEQNPEDWWTATIDACTAVLEPVDTSRNQIAGIGLSGQMHSFVILNKNGIPERPGITWMDVRARNMIPRVCQKIEEYNLSSEMQNQPAAGLTLLPLLWLQSHEPGILQADKGQTLLFVKDYIKFKLTGALSTESTDASASLLFDLENRCWSEKILQAFHIPIEILPKVRESGDCAGFLTQDAAQSLGIPPGIPVAQGAGDQQSAALATGVIAPGEVQLMLGTGAQVLTPISHYDTNFPAYLNIFSHVTGRLAQGSVQNAGSAMNWVNQQLGAEWNDISLAADERFAQAPYFLPYLTGERAPIMNSSAMGAWLDLRLSTSKEQLLYSAIEGVSFSIVQSVQGVLETARRQSDHIEIRCSGGGSSQTPFVQLISDTLGEPLTILDNHGASVTGAVILGAIAAGLTTDFKSGFSSFGLHQVGYIEPKPDAAAPMRERLGRFIQLQEAYLETIS
ncbi:xylulokinase [Spirochaeta dissipatitropha]